MSVNDPFVQTAFAEKLDGKQLVNFMADGNGEFTKALGLEVDLSVALLAHRSKRFSMIIKNNSVVHLNNEDGPAKTEISDASTVISQISK